MTSGDVRAACAQPPLSPCEVALIPAPHSTEEDVLDVAPPRAPFEGANHTAPRRRPTVAAVAWLVALALAGATGAASPSQDLGTSRTASADRIDDRIGAIFTGGLTGTHYCTASVIDSPRGNMIVTAAHCLSGDDSDKVFVPGYRDGTAPHGVWQITRTIEDPAWTSSADPDLDVAFAYVAPLNGRTVQQALGANRLAVDEGFDHVVTLTGYPGSTDVPITCSDLIDRFSSTQMRIDCTGYSDGTSGSPWMIPGQGGPTHDEGTVIGVIGGFETGGYTDDVSYSAYFDDNVGDLYREAVAQDGKG